MACQMTFQRYELKYLLSPQDKEVVLLAMKPYMRLDGYGRTTIRNVYLDTDQYRLIRRSLEKPTYKEKLRIRNYQSARPEDPDYTGVFDGLLREYTTEYELVQVKTTNMGSLFRLTYNLTLRDAGQEKLLIDQLRCRNGNLEISVSKQETIVGEL